jgi:flagellar biosynthesis GTPase FlhF
MEQKDQEHTNQNQKHTNQNQEHTNQNQEHTNQDQEHTNQDQEHTNQDQEHTNQNQEHKDQKQKDQKQKDQEQKDQEQKDHEQNQEKNHDDEPEQNHEDDPEELQQSIMHEEICLKLIKLRGKYKIPDIYALMAMDMVDLKLLYGELMEKEEREKIYSDLDGLRSKNQNIPDVDILKNMDFDTLKSEHEKYINNFMFKTLINNFDIDNFITSTCGPITSNLEHKMSHYIKQGLSDCVDDPKIAEAVRDLSNSLKDNKELNQLIDIMSIIIKGDSTK